MASTSYEITNANKWKKATEFFALSSEFCNIGIVIGVINLFYPQIMIMWYGTFGFLAHYMDAFIYVFKSLIRATKALGRNIFKIEFEEDVKEYSNIQTILDLIALTLFIATIVLLTAVGSPIAVTVAWCIAWIGLGLVGYSDYYLPKVDQKQKLEEAKDELVKQLDSKEGLNDDVNSKWDHLVEQFKNYNTTNQSFKLYRFLMVGLGALLICSSASVFATGTACLVLGIIAKLASLYLVIIAICRFINWIRIKCGTQTPSSEGTLTELKVNNPELSSVELLNLFSKNKNVDLKFEENSPKLAFSQ